MGIINRTISESKALKKLGIADFRHITKDKVVELVSMLDRLEPEVAKKALEQFPEFAKTMREALANQAEATKRALESSEKGMTLYGDTCKAVIDVLKAQLEKDDITLEERREIMSNMMEIVRLTKEVEHENKMFLFKVIGTIVAAGSALILSAAATIGVNTSIARETEEEKQD